MTISRKKLVKKFLLVAVVNGVAGSRDDDDSFRKQNLRTQNGYRRVVTLDQLRQFRRQQFVGLPSGGRRVCRYDG